MDENSFEELWHRDWAQSTWVFRGKLESYYKNQQEYAINHFAPAFVPDLTQYIECISLTKRRHQMWATDLISASKTELEDVVVLNFEILEISSIMPWLGENFFGELLHGESVLITRCFRANSNSISALSRSTLFDNFAPLLPFHYIQFFARISVVGHRRGISYDGFELSIKN